MDVSTRGLRRIWFYLHLWIGVGLALAIIPLSLSGSYLVWRDQIDHATHPARFAVSSPQASLAPSAYLAAAQAAFGDRARVAGLRLPSRPGDPVTVTGAIARGDATSPRPQGGPQARQQLLTAWIDPGTAKVLDVANIRQGFSMWVHDLHGQFFVFGTGRQVVGWFGVVMLVSCLSGVWLWWPRSGSLARALRWSRTPDTLLNLHHVVGFWIAIPLAVLSLSGALIAFPPFTRAVVGAVAPVAPQPAGRGPGGPGGGGAPVRRTELSPDQAAMRALDANAGARLASLALPTRGGDTPAWRVQLKSANGATLNLMIEDAEDGGARVVPDRIRLGGDQAIRFNRQLHDGDDMPLLWQLIITVAGLAPAVLGVTGVIVWARRQLRKASLRRQATVTGAQPVPAE